ncbi:MAG: hypothetical protein ACKVQA_06980 [Burkholderiales bacterium]
MRRISQRKDANHDTIVTAYESYGWQVLDLTRLGDGKPDIAVAPPPFDRLYLVEIKTPKGKLKLKQVAFAERWPVRVVRTSADVAAHVAEIRNT